jgi:hypothetical protein
MKSAYKWLGAVACCAVVLLLPMSAGASGNSPLTIWATSNGATENATLDSAAAQYATALAQGKNPPVLGMSLVGIQIECGVSDTYADALPAVGAAQGVGFEEGSSTVTSGIRTSVVVFWKQEVAATPVVPVTVPTVPVVSPTVPVTTPTVPVTTTTATPTTTTTVATTAAVSGSDRTLVRQRDTTPTTSPGPVVVYKAQDKSPAKKGPLKYVAGLIGLLGAGGLIARKLLLLRV